MDVSTILIKLAGLGLLVWTGRSIYLHVKEKQQKKEPAGKEAQSISEQILNNTLLYLWLVFMLVFSSGMIINN